MRLASSCGFAARGCTDCVVITLSTRGKISRNISSSSLSAEAPKIRIKALPGKYSSNVWRSLRIESPLCAESMTSGGSLRKISNRAGQVTWANPWATAWGESAMPFWAIISKAAKAVAAFCTWCMPKRGKWSLSGSAANERGALPLFVSRRVIIISCPSRLCATSVYV